VNATSNLPAVTIFKSSPTQGPVRLFACHFRPCPVAILLTIRLSEDKLLSENAILLWSASVVWHGLCGSANPRLFAAQGHSNFLSKSVPQRPTDCRCRFVRTCSFQIASGPPVPRGKGILHAAVNKALSSLWSRSLAHTLRKTRFRKSSQTNENARHVSAAPLRRPLVADDCGA
jgi:hypothetical protein